MVMFSCPSSNHSRVGDFDKLTPKLLDLNNSSIARSSVLAIKNNNFHVTFLGIFE